MKEELRLKSEQLASLVEQSTDRQEEIETLTAVAGPFALAQEENATLRAAIQDLETRLLVLAETQAELEEVRKELGARSFSNGEVDAIKLRCGELETEVGQLQQTVKDLEAEEFVARQGKEAALEHVSELESSIKALEEQLVHDEEVYGKIISELKEEKA